MNRKINIAITDTNNVFVLLPHIKLDDYKIVGYDWFDIKTNSYNSCSFFETQKEAVECYREGFLYEIKEVSLFELIKEAGTI